MDARGHLHVLRALTRTEFRLRDQGTLLGFTWTLLHPLLLFLVLHTIFARMTGSGIDRFGAYLLIGIAFWNFFSSATAGAIQIFPRRAALIRNSNVSRTVLVLSGVLTYFLSHLLELSVLLPLLLLLGCVPGVHVLFLPVVLLLELLLVLGVSFLLSTAAVYFRDVERIWSILSLALFLMTPVFYAYRDIPGAQRVWVQANPVTHIVAFARGALLHHEVPGLRHLALFTAAVLALLAVSWALFRRQQGGFAERV
ncbi:MAG: ABC transporter permease [Planctomycetes bacterium]|nr:ABC transporter permease [Planctomycetota bacterium]